MSNTNDNTNTPIADRKNTVNAENNSEAAASKSKRWSFIQSDLEKALDTWQELEKNQAKLSPEEEQFEKIKTIIGQLKSKIEQF